MLPYLGEKGIMRPSVRTGFGGLDHNLSAGDGEIYWMQNLSGREYPLMTPRVPRVNYFTPVDDMGAVDALFYTYDGSFFYGGWGTTYGKGSVTAGQKQFLSMGDKILIFPDKKYYAPDANAFGSLELTYTGAMEFRDGTYAGVPAEGNTLFKDFSGTQSWHFKVGDAVTVSGCIVHPENNKTAIVREVEGKYLRFYENAFNTTGYIYTVGAGGLAAGTYHFDPGYQFTITTALYEGDVLRWMGAKMNAARAGIVNVTEGNQGTELAFSETEGCPEYATVSRTVPDLDFWCVNENRLWGCKGDTIYASALGDPFNFNVFDGLSTDSWQSETEGKGDFTGCVSYGGYPIFFKEDCIIKVQGDRPSNFQWTLSSRFGVKAGCGKSLAVAGETLFYVSPAGVCAYNGGAPRVISEALGRNEKWSDAVAGSDGISYYVSMKDSKNAWHLFLYDTRYGEWFREDDSQILTFVWFGGEMYMVNAKGAYHDDTPGPHWDGTVYRDLDTAAEWAKQSWTAEFADSTRFYETTDTGSQDKKGLLRLQLRCSLAQGATVKAWVMYDSSGTWQEIATVTGETGGSAKRSYNLPLILRRCDHYRIKLTGTGESVIYSLTEVRYSGSNHQGGSVTLPSGT